MPLEYMRSGETGIVAELHGEAVLVHRLEEMGLRPGTEIRVLQGGTPVLLQVGESRLSLRMEGLAVLVRPGVLAAAG